MLPIEETRKKHMFAMQHSVRKSKIRNCRNFTPRTFYTYFFGASFHAAKIEIFKKRIFFVFFKHEVDMDFQKMSKVKTATDIKFVKIKNILIIFISSEINDS